MFDETSIYKVCFIDVHVVIIQK